MLFTYYIAAVLVTVYLVVISLPNSFHPEQQSQTESITGLLVGGFKESLNIFLDAAMFF